MVTVMTKTKLFFQLFFSLLIITCAQTSTFSGIGNWSNAGNWDNGVPTNTTNAIISSGTVTIDGDYECADLTINSGAVLSITAGQVLIVTGTLTNNSGTSGLILKSDISGTAQLVNNTAGVEATVEQYIVKNKWHYVGLPVYTSTGTDPANYTNDTYTNYVVDAGTMFPNCYVAWSDERSAEDGKATGWYFLSQGDALHVLQGYAIKQVLDQDITLSFSGTLNTGTVSVNWDSEFYGYNLICNPYPTTINWDAPGGKNLTHTNNAFYVWDDDLGVYRSYVDGVGTNGQTSYIAPNQGFFIQVYQVYANMSLTDLAKVSNKTGFSKPIKLDPQIILAITDDNEKYDEFILRENIDATVNFDSKYDATKMVSKEAKVPLLYSSQNGIDYSICSIAKFDQNLIIPLNILVKSTGKQTLVLKGLKGINESLSVFLFDEHGNKLNELNEEGYSFDGIAGETMKFYVALSEKINIAD